MRKIAFAAAILAFAASAHAAPPSDAAIRELMDATNARANMTVSVQNLARALPQILRVRAEEVVRNNPKLNDEQRKAELANVDHVFKEVPGEPNPAEDYANPALRFSAEATVLLQQFVRLYL